MNIQQGRIDTVQEIVTRGFNYLDQGHLDTAVALFTTVIELEPDRAVVYHYRGEAYYTQGAFDNAISDFSKAIAIEPKFAEAYSNRGLAYDAKGELDLAIQDYNTAIRLNPHEALAYYNRAMFYSFGEEIALDLAIQDYNMAIKLDRYFVDAYQNRGLSYLMLEEFDLAVKDFDMAIKLNPNLDNAYKSRGLAYAFMGKFEHAVNDYSKAIELDPDDAETYRHRGKAWMHLNEWEKSAADLVAAGDLAEDVVASLSVSDFESGDNLEDSGNIAERSTRQEATGDTPLPQSRYALPILTALEQFNGSAKTKDVLGKVRQLMENHIGDIDLSHRSDGQVYMENRAQAMRSELVRKGLMKDDSLHGIWEISDAGREYLHDSGGP